MSDTHKILAVHLTDRVTEAVEVQKVFTEYGCNIKTRVGLHDVAGDYCAPGGVIILELVGPEGITAEVGGKLGAITGVETKIVEFPHGTD